MKENLKCSFVIPGYKCDEYIFRNIESILDQDYKNYEIVVVLNGEWETRKELFSSLKEKYPDKIQIHWIPQNGLGNANNFGFEKSTGDIISHLSSDLYINPGTLRTWVDAFNDNQRCDLVYSGYRLISPDPSDVYYSNEYDRYHLECENFIDGANPYRRNAFKKWSTDLRSLIDWDWSLSITSSGKPAYYIKEPLYNAEPPKKGGLSEDSNFNWVKRRKEVRDRHNIPDRRICIASMEPKLALHLAKMCDFDFRVHPGYKPHDYSLIYVYGFPASMETIQTSTSFFFQHFGYKVIHWLGEDLKSLMEMRWYDVNSFVEGVLSRIQTHFCINMFQQKILSKMGVHADIVYPPVLIPDIKEKIDAVSVNDLELMEQLQKAMPDIQFKENDLSCNITVHYMDDIANPLKSIALGNHVITNIHMPNTYYIQGQTNVPELRKLVTHTIRNIRKANEEIPKEVVSEYRDRIKPSYFKAKIEKLAEKKIQKYGRLESTYTS